MRVALLQSDPRLRPGMTARIRVAVERLKSVVIAPVEAVFNSAGQDVVYVLVRNGVSRRPVQVDRRNADHAVIKRGAVPGERVSLEDPARDAGGVRP